MLLTGRIATSRFHSSRGSSASRQGNHAPDYCCLFFRSDRLTGQLGCGRGRDRYRMRAWASRAHRHSGRVQRRGLSGVTVEVRVDGIGVELPRPGHGMTAAAIGRDLNETSLSVWVDLDGLVHARVDSTDPATIQLVSDLAEESSAAASEPTIAVGEHALPGSTATASVARCSDTSRNISGRKWLLGDANYRINNTEGLPKGISSSEFSTHVYQAKLVWERATNSCGLTKKPDTLKISQVGTTTANSNINGTTEKCTAAASPNVVDFGPLSKSLGLACTAWATNNYITSADIRIDNSARTWYAAGEACSSNYEIRAVLTHEFGHLIGIDHATERGRGDLTMSPKFSPCDSSARNLGRGDVLAVAALY